MTGLDELIFAIKATVGLPQDIDEEDLALDCQYACSFGADAIYKLQKEINGLKKHNKKDLSNVCIICGSKTKNYFYINLKTIRICEKCVNAITRQRVNDICKSV